LVTQNSQVLAVHAAVVPTGQVLFFGGSEHDEQPGRGSTLSATRLWDPADNRVKPISGTAAADLFCCGHCLLPGGELLVAGGTEFYDTDAALPSIHRDVHHFSGIPNTAVFDWRDNSWHAARPMAEGRWYPTCITLSDGRVFTLSGHGSATGPHEVTTVEFFTPGSGTWSSPSATTPPLQDTGGVIFGFRPMVYYPRLHLLPDGRIFSATALRVAGQRRTRAISLPSLSVTDLAPPPGGSDLTRMDDVYSRSAFPSVLLPLRPPGYGARILIFGEKKALLFEPNNPHLGWRQAGTERPYPMRAYANAVLLPDGSVLVVGGAMSERGPFGTLGSETGGEDRQAIHAAERYVPETNAWQTLAFASERIARVYHSVALLLPDARVWVAGSNHDSARNRAGVRPDTGDDARELRIEVFSPPYLFTHDAQGRIVPAPRPRIARVRNGSGYGLDFTIETPDAGRVRSVVLVRCGSATHAFNPDQRLVELEVVQRTEMMLRAKAPPNGFVAPPGYYLLFLVNQSGTPSVARFFQLASTYPLVEVYLGRDSAVGNIPVILPETDALAADHPHLHLGTLELGQSRTAVLRCKNVGTGILRIIEVTLSGDLRTEPIPDDPFAGTRGKPRNAEITFAPGTAPPGSAAEVRIRFTPTELGRHRATVSVITNSPELGGFFIDLEASVPGLAVEVTPSPLDFGDVAAGTQASRSFTVRNTGTVDAFLVDVVVTSASPPGQFATPSVLPNRFIPLGQSQTYGVGFAPTKVGQATANLELVLESSPAPASFSTRTTLPVRGAGVGPAVRLTPSRLQFGPEFVRRESAPQTVTIENAGTAPLAVTDVRASSHWRAGPPRHTQLAPGANTTVDVAFQPGLPGLLQGELTVTSNAFGPPASIPLEGEGVPAPLAELVPAQLNFGDQPLGTSGTPQGVEVVNDGVTDLVVASVALAGPNAADFRVTSDTCRGALLGPEQSCQIAVAFEPSALGVRDGELVVTHNSPLTPARAVLSGSGVAASARTVSPTTLAFPSTAVGGTSAGQRSTLTNNGSAAFRVTSVNVRGGAAADFAVDFDECGGSDLGPGASCDVEVAFRPRASGNRQATLVLDDGSPTPASVALEGVALGPVVSFDRTEVTFPSQRVGTFSQREEITLRNIGNATLMVSSITVSGDFLHDVIGGSALPPNGFLIIRLVCQPSAVGAVTGTVTVTDNAPDSPHTVSLAGTGT
jgi:galactose oxidase-like protein/HYDIN/CFA65/VesB family protein/uncharacterized protein DUF1573